MMIVEPQCGNYGNFLSHYFDKNFVKVISTKEVTKVVDFTRNFFDESEYLVFPHCAVYDT